MKHKAKYPVVFGETKYVYYVPTNSRNRHVNMKKCRVRLRLKREESYMVPWLELMFNGRKIPIWVNSRTTPGHLTVYVDFKAVAEIDLDKMELRED